jgi:hypothetical protein
MPALTITMTRPPTLFELRRGLAVALRAEAEWHNDTMVKKISSRVGPAQEE